MIKKKKEKRQPLNKIQVEIMFLRDSLNAGLYTKEYSQEVL